MTEWPLVRLGDIAADEKSAISKPYGSAILRDDYRDAGVPVVRGVNLARGRFYDDEFVFISQELADRMPGARLQPGDLVFTHRGSVGQISMIPRAPRYHRYTLSTSQVKARLDPTRAIPEFFYYWFLSPAGRHSILQSISTVGVPGLARPVETIKSLLVPLPPLEEQRQIAEALGILDDLIDNERRIALVGPQLARALIHDASAKGREWRVQDVAEIRRGLSYKGSGLSAQGIPMVNMGSAADFGWLKRSGWKYYLGDYKPRHLARAGDLIITNTEQTWRQEIIGWPLLVPSDTSLALFTHHMYLVDFKPEFRWLRLPLWAYLYQPEARALLDGAVRGTTVANLPVDVVERLIFRAPEQGDPALAAARRLLESSWSSELGEAELVHARDELLPLLLSGRVRVENVAAS